MKKKIKKIREACIKANSEIVKLKFGCEVVIDWLGNGVVHDMQKRFITDDLRDNGNGTVIEDSVCGDIEEIIGRPIRLADVLLAIDKYVKIGNLSDKEKDGGLSYLDFVSFIYDKWNLEDNNLQNQSPETIDFIHKLLTPTLN